MDHTLISVAGRLSRRDAAAWFKARGFRISEGYLANLASANVPPAYLLIQGRAYYHEADLVAFARSRIGEPVRRAADSRTASPEAA